MRFQWTLGVAMMLVSPLARAESKAPEPPCGGPRITLDPSLTSRQDWERAVEKTRAQLKNEHDVDTCAALDVSPQSPGAIVRAALPDGRVAERTLSLPDDLPKAVTALISLPPAPLPAVEASPAPKVRDRASPAPPNEPAHARPASTGLELGVGPASRFG